MELGSFVVECSVDSYNTYKESESFAIISGLSVYNPWAEKGALTLDYAGYVGSSQLGVRDDNGSSSTDYNLKV